MKYNDISKRIAAQSNISIKDLLDVLAAVSEVFPLIILVNLTKNQYTMLRHEAFLHHKVALHGNFDELIAQSKEDVHPSYRDMVEETFGRENLINAFNSGIREQMLKLYQKNQQGEYHWTSSHCIRLSDESGDMVCISLNKDLN